MKIILKFTCYRTLNKSYELKEYLINMYASAAQYNHPPRYPVTVICGGIDKGSFGSDILSKIYAGVVALRGNTTCKVNDPSNVSETTLGWRWQVKIILHHFSFIILFLNYRLYNTHKKEIIFTFSMWGNFVKSNLCGLELLYAFYSDM